jgi:sugar/nucleoside kinase (ribokinase family)
MDSSFDILGIGNAIVDVIAPVDDAWLERQGVAKGTMTLIDSARAASLYAAMGRAAESSGGSAANTCAAAASLGARAAFIGKVANDALGQAFRADMARIGVAFDTPFATDGAPTAQCLIAVSPDAQRSMNTFLGACVDLSLTDIDEHRVAMSAITYLEGYLFDPPEAQAAFRHAAQVAHAAGRRVALTLSDPFCVERHRTAFRDLVRRDVDILFANEAEITALYRCDFDQAVEAVRAEVAVAALTRSQHGSVIVTPGATHRIDAAPAAVLDTTGAGDAYAAGVLTGMARGRPLPVCGRMGSIAASEAISHYGARPETPLAALVARL